MGLGALGAGAAAISAIGAATSAVAQGQASSYQSQVAKNNQQIAGQNANYAASQGAQQVNQEAMQVRGQIGQQKAAQASSGLDVNSGSAVDVRASTAQLGQQSIANVRNSGARQVYGYTTQGQNFGEQAAMDQAQADQAPVSAALGATSSLLSSSSGISNPSTFKALFGTSGS